MKHLSLWLIEDIKYSHNDSLCFHCNLRGICARTVRTKAPLPCWAEYLVIPRKVRDKLRKIPVLYLDKQDPLELT